MPKSNFEKQAQWFVS